MVPCQAAPALETTMSTPPKAETTVSKAARTLCRIGDVAVHRQRLAADLLGRRLRRLQIAVEDGDFRAFLGHRLAPWPRRCRSRRR